MTAKRGQVYLCMLPGATKPRPVIVLTADWLNGFALDVVVVPVTSVARPTFPTRVPLVAGEGGLKTRSWAKCDQVSTVPKTALRGNAFGAMGAAALRSIGAAIMIALDIDS